MKVTVQNIIVDRDMVTKISKQVWPWEVPVYEAKFGEGRVRTLGTEEIEVQELPDVDTEFARLVGAHGIDSGDSGTNQAYAELAYGRGRIGKDALAKQMGSGKQAAKKKVSAKKPKAAEADDGDGDPLDFG